MSEYRLTQEIIARSTTNEWDTARGEWKLVKVYESDGPETCLCGHTPIIEVCILRNTTNRNLVLVGNCCVKKFIGLPSDLIFQAMKRIREDVSRSLNEQALVYALGMNWINDWEFRFYIDNIRKRSLSAKQKPIKERINQKVLAGFARGKR